MKIQFIKMGDGAWLVIEPKSGICADISRFEDRCINGTKSCYRVDARGQTIDTMIDNFQTAKKIAYKNVRNRLKTKEGGIKC